MLADAVVTHDATSHLPPYIVAPTLPLRQSQKKADSSEFGVVREFVYVCCCWGFVGDDLPAKADVVRTTAGLPFARRDLSGCSLTFVDKQ